MSASSVPLNVYLETSIVAAAIIGGSAHSQASRDVCAALSHANSTVYFSRLVRIEVLQILKKYATKDLATPQVREAFRLDQFSRNLIIRQRWLDFGIQQLDVLIRTFYRAYELPIQGQTCQRCMKIMSQHNLDSYDAIHVATAMHNNVRDFVTVDGDFTRVGELKVILVRDPTP